MNTRLFQKYQKNKSDIWLLNLKILSIHNVDAILSSNFISDLEELNTWLYKGIVDKSISKACISSMFEFLSELYIYIDKNINSQDCKEIFSKIDELMSYCIYVDDELELSCENIQLNEWKNTSFFHLCPKGKYNINSFSTYRYIDKLKSDTSLDTLKNDKYFMNNYKTFKTKELIEKLEGLYLNDNPDSTITMKSYVSNDYRKIKSLLNILLDGDVDSIKQNGHCQFYNTCAISLNILLNEHFDDDEYNDNELIEQFTSNLKKGNIKRFDSDDNDNKDDPYYLYTNQFGPFVHNIIANLYNVFTFGNFSDINTALTYELLTHEIYNKLVKELNLLYEDILNNHSTNIASVHVTRIIHDRFSPIFSMTNVNPMFSKPEKTEDDVKITYDSINAVLMSFKTIYNIYMIKNESCKMEYLQRLTENIIDLRALLNLTNTKGTA